ncbi:MAG: aminotransferase class V-fold PLP-dependent enzyme [Bacteroidia bacterium]|nr:aminotransferase class V-fold PLP-dependent enzyme [Bacteroidia bacterium]
MKQFIYADNAATTQLSKAALDAMMPWMLSEYGNASQPYSFARKPKKALMDARAAIADCINAQPDEIFFTSGGTESDNWVIKGSAFSDAQKRATITSAFEHHAILHSCYAIERLGYPVAYLMPTEAGLITTKKLQTIISDTTRLVSIMYANNEIGSIQPIKELCEVAHSHGALFHTDAVQAVGHVKIDVQELGVDMLSASAHKFNGPKGIGFLYIRKGTTISPYSDGGAQEMSHRAGTENIAAIVGMAAALIENCNAMEEHIDKAHRLEKCLLDGLCAAHVTFSRNGGDNILPGLLSLSFPGADGEAILHRMDLFGICISTGSACNSESTEISHVLRAIRLEESLAKGTIRIALGKNNSEDDVDRIVQALVRIAG